MNWSHNYMYRSLTRGKKKTHFQATCFAFLSRGVCESDLLLQYKMTLWAIISMFNRHNSTKVNTKCPHPQTHSTTPTLFYFITMVFYLGLRQCRAVKSKTDDMPQVYFRCLECSCLSHSLLHVCVCKGHRQRDLTQILLPSL